MKTLITLITVLLVTSFTMAETKEELIEKVIEVSNAEVDFAKATSSLMEGLKWTREDDDDIDEIFKLAREYFRTNSVKPIYASALDDTFTKEELKLLIKYYESLPPEYESLLRKLGVDFQVNFGLEKIEWTEGLFDAVNTAYNAKQNTKEKETTAPASDISQIVIKPDLKFTAEEKVLIQQADEAIKSYVVSDLIMSNLDASIESLEWKLSKFYLRRAEAYFLRKGYEKAENDFRKILATSKNGFIEYKIGDCLYNQVKYHEALDMFRRAQAAPGAKEEERTHYAYPYYEGLCLIQIKKLDEAKALFDQLKNDFPDRDLSKVYLWFPEEKSETKKNPNQRIEPIMKTPVDEVEAQGAQPHP